jgi:2-oxoglutarate ferredoxin oxidoreductase subunit delta
MAKVKGAIVVNAERCKGCGVCVVNCLQKVIELGKSVNSKGYYYAYQARPDDCTGCTNCAVVCPDGAITVYRTKIERG